MKHETLTFTDITNLRTLISVAGSSFRGGRQNDAEWIDRRDALYRKLGRIRAEQEKQQP